MTAVAIHRPEPRQRSVRPTLTLVPPAVAAPEPAQLRLTRRGRLVLFLALVLATTAVLLALTGAFGGLVGDPADAGGSASHPATRSVVVQPGQTLWQIAGQVAPGADRRDTVQRIVDLNALPGAVVSAGQRLAVPGR